jgi:hypothetical protein
MSTMKLKAAAVFCIALAASGAFAQDQKAERREKLRRLGETAAGIAAEHIERASEAKGDVVAGHVVMLQGQGNRPAKVKEVNNGGLIVIRVADSGSRPPENIKVDAGSQFLRLGQVRGVAQKKGQPQSGGGYTWILLKPVADGEGSLLLSFTPTDGSAAVKREFKVNVVEAEEDAVQGN